MDFPSKDGEAMSETHIHRPNASGLGTFGSAFENMPRWFAVYTTPRHEKHVSGILAERGIDTFLPLYRTTRQWKKSRSMTLELPLFPAYVFVRIVRQARGSVLGTPGVLSIVGSSREAWPLPDLEIDALRSGLLERRVEPHPFLVVGERVRIIAGVMAGIEGVLVRKKNDLRVVLSLDTIMRSVAVEVNANEIEPGLPSAERQAATWVA
jgi:transcription antitermination factor NusG